MNDLIDRQDAIDALREEVEWEYDEKDEQWYYIEADMAIGAIERLPSAQPERKKGKWINRSLNILYPEWERYTCSVCGKHSYSYDFCPHCGSYNGGENHDKG